MCSFLCLSLSVGWPSSGLSVGCPVNLSTRRLLILAEETEEIGAPIALC